MVANVHCRLDGAVEDSRAIPEQVFHDEVEAIRSRRKHVKVPPLGDVEGPPAPTTRLGLNGLAISGGGIRSATFSLGVMQALAHEDALKYMDYLSTVSGGGYSGSALTWSMYGETENDDYQDFIDSFDVGKNFPIGTDNPRKAAPAKPDSRRQALLRYFREHGKYLIPGAGIGVLSMIGVLLRGIVDNLVLWVPLVTTVFLLMFLHGQSHWFDTLSPFYIAIGFGISMGIIYSLGTYLAARPGNNLRYWMRRSYEKFIQPYLLIVIILLVIGTMQPLHLMLDDWLKLLSPAMIFSGISTGVWTYVRSSSSDQKRKLPMGPIATVGSLLFIYGVLIGGFVLAKHLSIVDERTVFGINAVSQPVAWAALFTLLLYGWCSNTNYLSLHRYYRDRLMETFMPEISRAVEGKTGPSYPANMALMSDMWDADRPRGPYHIVNTNLVLVDSRHRKQRSRGGENFILSPFYCGSESTGWRSTKEFEANTMTLATAMAISGAAANPNTGVAGKGLSRNRMVSLLMSLLNLRLGYWVSNPARAQSWWRPPNHFNPGLYELHAGFQESKAWLQLSDGGHFENLALYELIRRRLKLIVVLDGGADPNFNFSDLQTASGRVAEDFGTRITFDDLHPGALVYDNTETPGRFPAYPGRAEHKFITATIDYPGNESGKLIYVKTTMVEGLSVECQGYKDAHPTFPDEPTSNQFFSPEQFEAYRELGYVIGLAAAGEIKAQLGIV